MREKFDFRIPEFISRDVDTIEKLEDFEFEDTYHNRRFIKTGNNQIAGVVDGFELNSPVWIETIKTLHKDFLVYRSMIEFSVCLTLDWSGE